MDTLTSSPSPTNRRIKVCPESKSATVESMPDTPTVWHSCCLTADKHFVMYVTQISVILLIIIFCIYQLLTLRECIHQITYTSLLTLLIGLVIPSPAIRKR